MKTILVDDSEIDRMNLRLLLEKYKEIQICGEAHDLQSAENLIRSTDIDLLFLDIHLGKDKGFTLLNSFEELPEVVLTTSHPQYALKGFEIDALDYILKPVTSEKLERAMSRIASASSLDDNAKLAYDSQIFFMKENEYKLYSVSDISLVAADRPYTKITVSDGSEYHHKRSIKSWKEILPSENFLPLDRATLLNVHTLAKIIQDDEGDHYIYFKNSIIPPLLISPRALKILRDFIAM